MTLLDAIKKAATIIPKKGKALPILQTVLIEPAKNGITISVNDISEVRYYQAEIPGLKVTGAFTIPCKPLLKVLGTIDKVKSLRYDSKRSVVVINKNIELQTGKAEDYPKPPISKVKLSDYVKVELKDTQWLISAASDDKTRYNINTLHIDTKAGYFVATDGHRMHRVPAGKINAESVTIPKPSILSLLKFKAKDIYLVKKNACKDCTGTGYKPYNKLNAAELDKVALQFKVRHRGVRKSKAKLTSFYNDRETIICPKCKDRKKADHILWIGEDELLYAGIVDTAYPDYAQVVPKETPREYTADSKELSTALKQCSAVSPAMSGERTGVFLAFTGKRDTIRTSDTTNGNITIVLSKGTKFKGLLPFGFTICAKYLAAVVGDEGKVTLKFNEELDACVAVKGDRFAVLMPMRGEKDVVAILKEEARI